MWSPGEQVRKFELPAQINLFEREGWQVEKTGLPMINSNASWSFVTGSNLIGAKLIVQLWHFTDRSVVAS